MFSTVLSVSVLCPCCVRAVSVLSARAGSATHFFLRHFPFVLQGSSSVFPFFLLFSCFLRRKKGRVPDSGEKHGQIQKDAGGKTARARRGRRERFRRSFHDCIFFVKECNVAEEAAGKGSCFSCFLRRGGAVYFFLDKVCEKKMFWRLLEMSAFMFFFCLILRERKFA